MRAPGAARCRVPRWRRQGAVTAPEVSGEVISLLVMVCSPCARLRRSGVGARREAAMLSGQSLQGWCLRGCGLPEHPPSARLAFGIPLPAAAPRRAQWGWDSQRVVPRLFLALEGISFGEGLVGRLLARSELCSGLAVTGAGYLLNQSVFKWIT